MSCLRLRVLLGVFLALATATALAADVKPLAEKDLVGLLELQVDDAAIIARIQKAGLGFSPDAAAIARLKQANASEGVLKAVETAAAASKPAPSATTTYQQLTQLLSLGMDEQTILDRLQKAPTTFTPGAAEIAELKKLGATEKILAAMQQVRQLPAATAELVTDFAVVLDCSGSMREPTEDGGTKMAAAKRVVTQLVQKIPENLNVTFVIYGQEVFAANDPRNCRAVKIVRPLSRLDAEGKSELSGIIAGLQPTGATPIALSLKIAGEELTKNDAYCGLVLISDGKETCQGDPAAEAARLAQNPKLSFGVHVVGFNVGQDRASLEGIATAGKGKYYNADSAEELAQALGAVAEQLEAATKPADKKVVPRRAIVVHKPPIDEFPALGEIRLVSRGLGSISIDGKGGYGEEIRVPSAETKYDVMWVPKSGQRDGVVMLRGQVFAERKLVELRPEELLGLVRVNGSGRPKKEIVISRPGGLGSIERAAETTQFGQVLAVPAGKWDIWIDDDKIESGFTVEPGKLHELE